MVKRAKLPQANNILIGRAKPKEPEKIGTSKDVKYKTSKVGKIKRVQISVHFEPETLKLIEAAKYKLFTEYDLKVPKSKIIETVIKNNITDLEKLAELLR